MERLGGKRVIVTGAGAGIGEAIATRLSGEGAWVALADLDAEGAERVAREIEGKALARRTDVTRSDEVEALVGGVVEEWGGLDVMVNNAGIGVAGTTPETSE
jgi:NADP-dependent 3-hydroxy acid dehydrogenase YdfG